MFVGCSKISISVTVQHVQHIGIIRAFCLPGGTYYLCQCLGGQKKIVGLRFTRGNQHPG